MGYIKKPKKKLPLTPIIIGLMFLLGAGAFLYPTISNYVAKKNSSGKTGEYENRISNFNEEMITQAKEKAIEYNDALMGDPVRDPFIEGSGMALPTNYVDVLNIDGNGIMCVVEIPKIDVKLPVYHGTSKEVLEHAVGHIRQTPLPIGGIGNHSVLTGHTGLSHAKLFTDLAKLEIDDVFIINVLKETLVYQVDDISIILPDEIKHLEPVLGKDCVTLVTCTPYGINSHRLLVRGERTTQNEKELIEAAKAKFTLWDRIVEYRTIIVVFLFALLFITILIIYLKKSKQDKKKSDGI